MPIEFMTADQRLAEDHDKTTMAIFGRAKVGKTTLLTTLPESDTLAIDMEAGFKSVLSWRGPSAKIATWEDIVDLACLIGGIDANARYTPGDVRPPYFVRDHFAYASKKYEGFNVNQFKTFFFDSVTDLTRICAVWARAQPEAWSYKRKMPDTLGMYGLIGRECVRLLKHVQHAPGKNVIFVGGLQQDEDGSFKIQSEGSKTSNELPFIVDEIITLSDFDFPDGPNAPIHNFGKGQYRAFCCIQPNPWGLPAGDRSGKLNIVEEPHLGKLLDKINRR
jgi:hypothetical protein